jgi:hypothetical protein
MHKYLNTNNQVIRTERKNRQNEYKIHKNCTQWVNDLALYGVVPRKSLISYIPLNYLKTPEEEAAVMRGLFDSDGCIGYYGARNYGGRIYPKFNMCGSKQLCRDYIFLLKKNLGISCKIREYETYSTFAIQGFEKCQKIYDFLYGHDNFYIKRKKERFEKLLNGTFTFEDDNY